MAGFGTRNLTVAVAILMVATAVIVFADVQTQAGEKVEDDCVYECLKHCFLKFNPLCFFKCIAKTCKPPVSSAAADCAFKCAQTECDKYKDAPADSDSCLKQCAGNC